MRRTEKQWNYEEGVPATEMYEEEGGYTEKDPTELEGYGGEGYEEGYGYEYGDDLGNYGSGLSGHMEEEYGQEKKNPIEGIRDSAFLLNATELFSRRKDAAQIHENFRKYVADANSGNPASHQAAQEGACRDLEFFIMDIITRKFSTYVEKDRSFYEDLLQAGRIGIIAALPKYDPEKSMPTTYFFNAIRHEMVLQVNLIKHDTKSHVATTKRKIQEVDRMFARHGQTPTLYDYVYSIKCPFRRITNALAEMKAGNTRTSIDDPETAPLADRQSSMRSPEESAISNMNFSKILRVAHELEPRKEIIQCFIEMSDGRVKTSELAERYSLSPSEITEGVSNLKNLLRYNPDIRKMYPERFRAKEHELSEQIAYMPVEEGRMAMDSVLDSLKAMSGGGEEELFVTAMG